MKSKVLRILLFLSLKMEKTKRVLASDQALQLIEQLKADRGELMFHQSGGCCDGSQPMCFEKGDFIIGYSDV